MQNALHVAEAIDWEYKERFGRGYGLIESYRLGDAETVLVTAGTIASTARVVIDELREEGRNAGMVRIRLFRPFPKMQLIESLKHARRIVVIDRNLPPGQGGIFWEELKSALYGSGNVIPIFGFVLGLGGTNVSPSHIRRVFDMTEKMDEVPLGPIYELENEDVRC
jgi:pyruvate/2-oxoacid:ferredoxin oxidoreductase alpha subunit